MYILVFNLYPLKNLSIYLCGYVYLFYIYVYLFININLCICLLYIDTIDLYLLPIFFLPMCLPFNQVYLHICVDAVPGAQQVFQDYDIDRQLNFVKETKYSLTKNNNRIKKNICLYR